MISWIQVILSIVLKNRERFGRINSQRAGAISVIDGQTVQLAGRVAACTRRDIPLLKFWLPYPQSPSLLRSLDHPKPMHNIPLHLRFPLFLLPLPSLDQTEWIVELCLAIQYPLVQVFIVSLASIILLMTMLMLLILIALQQATQLLHQIVALQVLLKQIHFLEHFEVQDLIFLALEQPLDIYFGHEFLKLLDFLGASQHFVFLNLCGPLHFLECIRLVEELLHSQVLHHDQNVVDALKV